MLAGIIRHTPGCPASQCGQTELQWQWCSCHTHTHTGQTGWFSWVLSSPDTNTHTYPHLCKGEKPRTWWVNKWKLQLYDILNLILSFTLACVEPATGVFGIYIGISLPTTNFIPETWPFCLVATKSKAPELQSSILRADGGTWVLQFICWRRFKCPSPQWRADTKRWKGQMGCWTLMELSSTVGWNDFGTCSPCAVSRSPQGTAVFGWSGGGGGGWLVGWRHLQRPSLYPPPLPGLSPGQQSETWVEGAAEQCY